ncbi:uncharacterized protein LOC105691840 [Athalia rosae]|uniref:uncharacterized protein LOC105691840 n=1 Tax=Athalia rosae TaxID=37344 RepID=UPI002033D1DE|nr:uncharacterized protein LOC105691840 [Athalia rosae]
MGRSKKGSKTVPCTSNNHHEVPRKNVKDSIPELSTRISFPVVESARDETEDDTDEEETLEFNFRPRKMFLSNSCLICSRISSPGFLCKHCKMVSYCTKSHQLEDERSHEDLCKILSKLSAPAADPRADDPKISIDPEEYRNFRVGLIRSTEKSLLRYLDLWEKEIILYPRACYRCHRLSVADDDSLQCCADCKVVFWCSGHGNDHSKWCLQYQIFHKILAAQSAHGNANPHIPNVYFTAPDMASNDFDSFMSKVTNNSSRFRNMDVYNYTALSHLASVPLTVLYALQHTHRHNWRGLENFTLHLIGAEFHYEGVNLRVWEKLFLHFLPNLKNLTIVAIGPELFLPAMVPGELLTRVKLCRRCKIAGKTIRVSFVANTLYHDFRSSPEYGRPDMSCLFNPGLYRRTAFGGRDTWPKTISELCSAKVPIVVTAYTEREIPMDIARVKSVGEIRIVLTPRKNPYASLKPDRNFVSDETVPLIYKNYFLSIVTAV